MKPTPKSLREAVIEYINLINLSVFPSKNCPYHSYILPEDIYQTVDAVHNM